ARGRRRRRGVLAADLDGRDARAPGAGRAGPDLEPPGRGQEVPAVRLSRAARARDVLSEVHAQDAGLERGRPALQLGQSGYFLMPAERAARRIPAWEPLVAVLAALIAVTAV